MSYTRTKPVIDAPCAVCGKMMNRKSHRRIYCNDCMRIRLLEKRREYNRDIRLPMLRSENKKRKELNEGVRCFGIIKCCICGKDVRARSGSQKQCNECKKEKNRIRNRLASRKENCTKEQWERFLYNQNKRRGHKRYDEEKQKIIEENRNKYPDTKQRTLILQRQRRKTQEGRKKAREYQKERLKKMKVENKEKYNRIIERQRQAKRSEKYRIKSRERRMVRVSTDMNYVRKIRMWAKKAHEKKQSENMFFNALAMAGAMK